MVLFPDAGMPLIKMAVLQPGQMSVHSNATTSSAAGRPQFGHGVIIIQQRDDGTDALLDMRIAVPGAKHNNNVRFFTVRKGNRLFQHHQAKAVASDAAFGAGMGMAIPSSKT